MSQLPSPPPHHSLLTEGIQRLPVKDQPVITEVEVRGSSPNPKAEHPGTTLTCHEEVASEVAVNDIGWAEPRIPPTRGYRRYPHARASSDDVKHLTTRQKWGYADPEIIPLKQVITCKPDKTIVHKGFGRYNVKKEVVVVEERFGCFPPISNVPYECLNRSRTVVPGLESRLYGAEMIKHIIQTQSERDWALQNVYDEELTKEKSKALGELVADQIDWTRRLYNATENGASPPAGPAIVLWRKDFEKTIDDAVADGLLPFEICDKCGQRHIPWGNPVTLQDRDTCFSMLPAWFPAKNYDKPWDAFKSIINEVVRYSEIEQGRIRDPDRLDWDKQFHEPTREWRAVGRYGGWWKCRSGKLAGEEDIPIMEKECKLCHRAPTREEEKRTERRRKQAAQKVEIHKFIEKHIAEQMRRDREFVEARIRNWRP